MANAKVIWDFLLAEYKNPYGVAGLMGNLYAESGLNPKNLQNTFEKKLNMTDEVYTMAVDNGSYANFAKDAAGYGLAQWTYSARKLNLLTYAKGKKTSIGDLNTQLEFLVKEMAGYTAVVKAIQEAKSVKEASDVVLTKYERPADQSDKVKEKRASYGQKYYNEYAKKEEPIIMANYDKYIYSTGTHYISNSGSDERKKYTGGQAGDQTKKEWELKAWYNRPWTHVFRYEKDPRVGLQLAEVACAAPLNDNIGYDQYQRTTYWAQLKTVGYDPSKITVKCEEDCSAGAAANVKATGYLLGIKALQDVSSSMTSRNTVAQLKKAGFTVLTESKYTSSPKYLQPGDVLLYENHHVAINVTKGSKAGNFEVVTTPPANIPIPEFKIIGTATAKKSMTIRAEADANSKALGYISIGKTLEVIEILDNGWYKVIYNNSDSGFAYTSNRNNQYYDYKKLVVTETPVKPNVATGIPQLKDNKLAGTYIAQGKVNVRNNAGTFNTIMTTLPTNHEVTCEGEYSIYNNIKWLYVTFAYKGKTWKGFMSSMYLEKK